MAGTDAANGDDSPGELDLPNEGGSFPIVGIGASAGGLDAFVLLLKTIPTDTGMGFVLVPHLAPSHPSALTEILSRATTLPIAEVKQSQTVEPNHIYVIPPGSSMTIVGGALQLLPREDRGVQRPVDQFFRSLSEDQRDRAIGVVLSGTGTDGTVGLEAIKAEGGITFAQDGTAQHEGMPRSAIASGCVDFVLPPDEIAREIARLGLHPYALSSDAGSDLGRAPDITPIVQLLYRATAVDFTHYKLTTLYRRIARRMLLQKVEGLPEYVELLRETPAEVRALYQDLLIGVTRFFRDPEAFEALKARVLRRLIAAQSRDDPVRVWTVGCSTGQEAYSLAIALTELADAAGIPAQLQVFATDLNAAGIERARAGIYPKDIAEDVSPERLKRFFAPVDGSYRINKAIRDACVFSRHNVLADPPISRLDLISCRNLLIYLEPVLQKRIVPTLHYALKPGGFLWLGRSEAITPYRDLFEAEDAANRIYAKKPGSTASRSRFPMQPGGMTKPSYTPNIPRPSVTVDLPREADRALAAQFAPPGVLVSAELEILQFRGETGPYLTPAPGKASLSLLKMLREGLLVAVRAALLRADEARGPVREEGLRVRSNDGWREVAVEVIPLKGVGTHDGGYLVLFIASSATRDIPQPSTAAVNQAAPDRESDTDRLERELAATREYMQAVIEQQEAANEELQSANEEVQSANEELQSVNEELETSKEEIESSNEELATVNAELNSRNAELNRVSNDLLNLLGSVQMAIVLLGPDLRIRRFTPAAEKLLGVLPTDVGRPFRDLRLSLAELPDVEPLLREVIETVSVQERDVRDARGRWYSLRLRPYRTVENKIDGVVVMLVDVDAMKRAHALTESIVATVREPLLVLNEDLRVQAASRSFYETFRVTRATTEGRMLYELGDGQWDIPELRRLLGELLHRGRQVDDFTVDHELDGIGTRTMRLNARRLIQADEQAPLILLAIEDVTERKQSEEAVRAQRIQLVMDSMPQKVFTAGPSGGVDYVNPQWMEFTGLGFDDIRGWGWTRVVHPDDQAETVRVWKQSVNTGEPFQLAHRFRSAAGPYRWHLSRAVPLRDEAGRIFQWVGSSSDIHEQEEAAEALRKSSAELAEIDRHKNEFLAMLSHELRNPLAPMMNAMHIIRLTDTGQPAVRSASDMMERQIGQMVRLVDDLLDLSRISRGKIELRKTRIDLAAVVSDAVETARPLSEALGHELVVVLPEEPVYLDADPARLAQVVGNLLNNASKFTQRGGRIRLTAGREGDSAVLRVQDTGIGLATDQVPRIFDLFMQVDNSLERSVSGIGVGLTLVKELVELHNGVIEAHSAGLGQGSEFVVRLPLAVEAAAAVAPSPAATGPGLGARRILVVDDNRDAAMSLATLLAMKGNEIRTAHDGLEAVEAAAEFKPDAIVLDIGLPKLNGYDVARAIRQQPWGARTVMVALTGWGQEEDRRRSEAAGVNAHLVKPVDHAALEQLLAELLPH